MADLLISSENIRSDKHVPKTAALTAMHRQNRCGTERCKGIADQKEPSPDRPSLLLAGITGLLPQTLQHVIQLLPCCTAHRWLQPQGEVEIP